MTAFRIVPASALVLLLAACGGGGGDGGGTADGGPDADGSTGVGDGTGTADDGTGSADGTDEDDGDGSDAGDGSTAGTADGGAGTDDGGDTSGTGAADGGDAGTDDGGVQDDPAAGLPPEAEVAGYTVTLQSLWFEEDYPQDFPGNAHLSYVGGATHNAAVSFWEPGATASFGLEDVAESGRVEIFLAEEVTPAIENGTADSAIAFREFTFSGPDTLAIGLPTQKSFDIEVRRDWPRVTLVTMLGPSPDWFVGVDGQPLHEEGAWIGALSVDLPLYDGGTKSSVTPVMGGPDIVPPIPIELIAYDPASGTYGPSETPQIIARLLFERVR